ncbi:cutinase Cut4 [Mycolicibacterium canariasense]|uniref:Cutinase n=1 Tax=Mycolicibacterium canariasense TaxID=228230 RepID=A0A100WFE2_MYCCR|nr:cutinase family protein [Mycolicibacterium canariasense]MCV7211376.1 cutinase family protein [Mycolicibacterium canariasense]ORV03823.1 cutinase [Mycolicibacterium canariasense]GAS97272.1 cutinase Cut4 [Mycolicibacterium canariasense]
MLSVTLPKLSARIAAVGSALVAAFAFLAGPAPVASAEPCSDVELIFGRGTSEDPGIGRVGQALADALIPQLGGRTLSTYGINYPATYDFLTAADGAYDAQSRIATLAAQCPSTKIVLGGYSQGAAIVDMLIGIPPVGDRIGEFGSAPPLPGNLAGKVSAVAVFGNPGAKFSHPANTAPAPYGARAIDLCADGDPICSRGRNPFAHTRYESSEFIPQAASFVAALV